MTAAQRIRRVLTSRHGAFDFHSVLVAAVVSAVLLGGAAALVFGVIPFAQDVGAKSDLSAKRIAQASSYAASGRYLDGAGLVSAGYSQQSRRTAVGTNAQGSCYVGVAVSETGTIFYSTDKQTDAQPMSGSTKNGCVTWAALQSLVVAAGGSALTSDNAGTGVTTVGVNTEGQLGIGSNTTQPGPVAVAALAGKAITVVATGSAHSCAVAGPDTYCWGRNTDGQLGIGSTVAAMTPTKVAVLEGKSVTALAAGATQTCAIADEEAWCWGRIGTLQSPTPSKVTLPGPVTAIDAGTSHLCAATASDLYCWGNGAGGALGNGGSLTSNTPVKVAALTGKAITRLALGSSFSCAADAGSLYCWGANFFGQLGTGNTTSTNLPKEVPLLKGKEITSLAAGYDFTCAVAQQNTYCWGFNTSGQLGMGDTLARNAPSLVPSLAGVDVVALETANASSSSSACAVTEATGAYCWGTNNAGQLGTGDKTNRNVPTAVSILPGKKILSAIAGAGYTAFVTR